MILQHFLLVYDRATQALVVAQQFSNGIEAAAAYAAFISGPRPLVP